MGTNGKYRYGSHAGSPGAESIDERAARERFWRSLGRKVRKGAA